MRLIDVDKLKDTLLKYHYTTEHNQIFRYIDEQPTAYDLGNVVEQLESLKENYRKVRENTYCRSTETDDCDSCRADHYLEARLSTIDRVIEIMKGGGVNE